ncbi:response regulator transcription factor [Yinghuangia aomiensis]
MHAAANLGGIAMRAENTTAIAYVRIRPARARALNGARDPEEEPVTATGSPVRVVLVDDHEGYRRLATRLLTAWGYAVVGEAADGPGAVDAVRTLRPDLVLLDVQLPGFDGFTAAGLIREDDAGVGIVLISGRDRADYGDRVVRAQADGYVAKEELSPQSLAAVLATARRAARGTAEPA